MSLPAPRAFVVRFGKLKANQATALAFSLNSGTVNLTVNGVLYSITLSACGNDRATPDPAGSTIYGYAGTQVIQLSPSLVSHSWSATQGGNTASGTIRSAPVPGQDFAFGLTTCFASSRSLSADLSKANASGWSLLEHFRRSGAVLYVGTVHGDDITYADGFYGGAGESSAPDQNGKQIEAGEFQNLSRKKYTYAMYYGNFFGIGGHTGLAQGTLFGGGLDTDLQSLLDNSAFMPQFGDQEFLPGFGSPGAAQLSVVPNPYHKTANGFDGNGLVVWNQLCRPLGGDSLGSSAQHWKIDWGDVRIAAVEAITNLVSAANPTTGLGNAQIDDVLTTFDSPAAFKLLHSGVWAGREMPTYQTNHGFPLTKHDKNVVPAEYDRMYRNVSQTPKSLMDNIRTNGTTGCLVVASGDWHIELSIYQQQVLGGKATEAYYRLGLGQIGLGDSGLPAPIPADESGDGFIFEGGIAGDVSLSSISHKAQSTYVEVFGSQWPKKMRVRQFALFTPGPDNTIGTENTTSADFRDAAGPVNLGEVTDHRGNVWRCYFDRTLVQYLGNRGYKQGESIPVIPRVTKRSLRMAA